MAATEVTKMWSRDTAQTTDSGDKDPRTGETTRKTAYQVVVDDPANDDAFVAENAPGIPSIGSSYPGASALLVSNKSTTRMSPLLYMVEVEYKGEIVKLDDDPIDYPPKIQWRDVSTDEPIDRDINGYAIVNVNGEPVEGLSKPLADNTVTIERNYALFNPFLTSIYRDSVNSDEFLGYPPGTARLVAFSADQKFRSASDTEGYWTIVATVQFRRGFLVEDRKAWWKRYRNEGFYERTGVVVSISGGGGSGAVGMPIVSGGAISAIRVANVGEGYTTRPNVNISTTDSVGSGATATANINSSGHVVSIQVTAGGSGYNSRLVHATDDKKAHVTRPVLLKANGTRERNPDNAVFLYSPVHFELPYNSLGLV